MSLKSQNISNKWEQKYIKYKLKYNAIVKQIVPIIVYIKISVTCG